MINFEILTNRNCQIQENNFLENTNSDNFFRRWGGGILKSGVKLLSIYSVWETID